MSAKRMAAITGLPSSERGERVILESAVRVAGFASVRDVLLHADADRKESTRM
jgi:hypothetical protein